MDRIDQQPQQPTPTRYPTAPLPPAAESALARLDLRLNYPTDLYRAAIRHKVAAAATAEAGRRTDTRDLTEIEMSDFQYMQDVMRQTRGELAAGGRLDLIGATV